MSSYWEEGGWGQREERKRAVCCRLQSVYCAREMGVGKGYMCDLAHSAKWRKGGTDNTNNSQA